MNKNNANLTTELEKKQKELCDLKSKNQYLNIKLQEKQNKGEDWSS